MNLPAYSRASDNPLYLVFRFKFNIASQLWVATSRTVSSNTSSSRGVRQTATGLLHSIVFNGRNMASHKKLSKAAKKSRPSSQTKRHQEHLSPGDWFEKLVAIQKRLRDPGGCPWDREQTHHTLRTYLIEEAYEVLDALESGDDEKFVEELGDLLLQVTFHSQIASEEGRFQVSDLIRTVHEKMGRRHPHVFGEKRAKDSAEVLRNWHKIKAQERQAKESADPSPAVERTPESALDGVPRAIPATLEGLQLTKKAAG